ncbi:chemotaxis protein CheW, partial [Thiobaca trueperi]
QTVIKPLGRLLNHLRGFFAGSTILGSGEVAMILDVQELIRMTILHERTACELNDKNQTPSV